MSLIHYDIYFRNKELDEVHVRISDYSNYDPFDANPATFVTLTGVAPAFEIETFNTNEDKYSPILGQRATIRFKSTNAVNFSTFAQGEDYRFFVRATYSNDTKFIFSGWLLMDENQQAYLPPGQPVTLYATDGLGLLKDIELSTFTGARPSGKYRLIEVLAWCLRKTEGPFPGWGSSVMDGIKVADNLFENNHDNTDNCPLNQTYVDVLTFEKSVTEYEDCYTVLEKILFSRGARVCYYNNFWYVMRIDEYKNTAFFLTTYSIGGTYQSTATTFLDKYLDSDGTGIYGHIDFVQAQTIQRLQRPSKSVSINVEHRFPEETPLNAAFLHGAVIDDVLPLKTFVIDNWTLLRGFGSHATTTNSSAQIWRRYNSLEYETERYAVLTTPSSSGGERNYIKSSDIQICADDKFTFSFDYSADTDNAINGPASIAVACLALYGDDASVWILGDNISAIGDEQVPEWKLSDANHDTNADYYFWFFDALSGADDYRDWQSYSIAAPPAPVTGSVRIHFFAANQLGSAIDDFDIRYNNVKFDYTPVIGASYKETSGERYKMSTTDNYSKKTEQEYFLFDAPCKMFKGAMFYLNMGVYYLTSAWFDRVMNNYSPSEMLTIGERYLKWQVYYLWNQSRLPTLILNASLFGLDTANTSYAGLIHSYGVLNALSPTNNKYFIILSMRQDWHNCQWAGTFAEVNWNADRRSAGDFEFKYLE